MNTDAIRIQLVCKHLRIKDLSAQTGIDYDRLQKVLHGYRRPRPAEIQAIASVLGLHESEIDGSSAPTSPKNRKR